MQQITDWLQRLGMSECAQRCAESRIGKGEYRSLSDEQDLRYS